jgi:hypothetical protein
MGRFRVADHRFPRFLAPCPFDLIRFGMKLEEWSWVAGIVAVPLAVITWLVDREQAKTFVKNNAGLIVLAFAGVVVYVLWLRGWFSWLLHPVTWPVWGFVLVAVAIFALIALLFYFFGSVSETQPLADLDPLNYKSDEIFGVEWLWSYVYGKLNEKDLSAFCPRKNCMCRLTLRRHPEKQHVRQSSHGYGGEVVIPVSFNCPTCGFSREFNDDWDTLKHSVFIEIERRIRTGEFRQRMLDAMTKKSQARE